MNWDQAKGQWKQVKGKAQQQWGKLTDDDLDVIDGKREEFVGKIQGRYGIEKEEAEKQVNEWETSYKAVKDAKGFDNKNCPNLGNEG